MSTAVGDEDGGDIELATMTVQAAVPVGALWGGGPGYVRVMQGTGMVCTPWGPCKPPCSPHAAPRSRTRLCMATCM